MFYISTQHPPAPPGGIFTTISTTPTLQTVVKLKNLQNDRKLLFAKT